MTVIKSIAAITVGVFSFVGAANAANLVTNGDFSNPNVGGGYTVTNSVPGWFSNTSDGLEIGASNLYGLPCINDACQNDEVNANTFGSISQTITGLTVGRSYVFSWEYGGRTSGGPDVLDVSFGGTPVTRDTGSIGAWTLNSFPVVATSSSETLTFTSEDTSGLGGSPSYGNELTNVSLTGVPEPAAWALMIVGFGGVGAVARRRGKIALAA